MSTNTFALRYPKGLTKALTLSYDDGVVEDIRLVRILQQHGIKATFNLNSGAWDTRSREEVAGITKDRRLTLSEARELYASDGIEVACHALTHPRLDTLPSAQIAYEIIEDRKNLEASFGTLIRGGAYPFGTYNDTVKEALRTLGIVYYRTVKDTGRFDLPKDWLELAPTCHHGDPRLFDLCQSFLDRKLTHGTPPILFYLWGHAYEFEDCNNWDLIESFAKKMGGRDEIWYATNIEIYDYVAAAKQLLFSADMSRVHNPTATDVWFDLRERSQFAPAGKTVTLH